MENRKETVKEIKQKAKEFLEDRKNSNHLIDLLSTAETDDTKVLAACINAFHQIFSTVLPQKQMIIGPRAEDEELSAVDKYKGWLKQKYELAFQRLVELLAHKHNPTQELSLCTLMKFVECEANNPLVKSTKTQYDFPAKKFNTIMDQLVSLKVEQEALISRFQEFTEYDDVRYWTLKAAHRTLKSKQHEDCSIFLTNVHSLLENLSMPTPPESDKLTNTMCTTPDCEKMTGKMVTYHEHKKLFTSCWLEFLQYQLPVSLYKKVLVGIHEKVMPFMTSPIYLSDFLIRSYNTGGVVSLLALNGLFILVNKYNLDYPQFYVKLYSLLEPSVCHVKYRARFFYLLDLFLTSTHIPAYLVAAFAKRLSRIALTAPPSSILVIIPMVYNLIIRHPSCRCLLHRVDGPTDLTSDPFKADEADPAKCDSMNSSLWEIKTLQNHFHHSVAVEARKMEQPLPRNETEISQKLEVTSTDMFERSIKKKFKEMPTTFHPPKGLLRHKDGVLRELWVME